MVPDLLPPSRSTRAAFRLTSRVTGHVSSCEGSHALYILSSELTFGDGRKATALVRRRFSEFWTLHQQIHVPLGLGRFPLSRLSIDRRLSPRLCDHRARQLGPAIPHNRRPWLLAVNTTMRHRRSVMPLFVRYRGPVILFADTTIQ